MTDRILIIDFGSQVTQLIARRVRESGVYSEIHPFNKVSSKSIKDFKPNGVILSGGPASVTEKDTPRAPDELFSMGLPVLGICYGQQTMIERLGGKVETNKDNKNFDIFPIPHLWNSVLGGNCPTTDPYLNLTPAKHYTDGFFCAVLERMS